MSNQPIVEAIRRAKDLGPKLFSECYEPDPTNATAVASTVRSTTDPDDRYAALADPSIASQLAVLWDDKMYTITRPFPATTAGNNSLILGSLTDEVGIPVPVSIPANRFYSWFTSLVPAGTVEQFGLHVATEMPDTLQGLAVTNAEGVLVTEPPSMARLQFGAIEDASQEPRIAALPLCLPLAKGMPAPQGQPLASEDLGWKQTHPLLDAWRCGLLYLKQNNQGSSVTEAGNLFDLVAIGGIGTQPFANLDVVGYIHQEFSMLPPTAMHYRAVTNLIKEYSDQTWLHVAKSLQADTQPGLTLVGGGSGLGAPEITALVTSLQKNAPKSLKEEDFKDMANHVKLRYGLSFATLVPNEDASQPPTVQLAELEDDFEKALKRTSKETLQRELKEIIGTAIRSAKKRDGRMDSAITFEPDMIDDAFSKAIQTFNWMTLPLNQRPDLITSQLSPAAFAAPNKGSLVYKGRFANGQNVGGYESDDDGANKAKGKKATDLYVGGKLSTGHDLKVLIANFRGFWSPLIKNFDKSELWQALSSYEAVLHGGQGEEFCDLFQKNPQVGANILTDIHDIVIMFLRIGNLPEYRHAITRGSPVHPRPFMEARRVSDTIADPLRTQIVRMQMGPYKEIPRCMSHLPQLAGTSPANDKPVGDRPAGEMQRSSGRGGKPKDSKPVTDKKDADKKKGFLVWSGHGFPPRCPVLWKADGATTSERLCINFAAQGLHCKFGASCKQHHASTLSKLPPDAQKSCMKFVDKTKGLEFVEGKGPSSTST